MKLNSLTFFACLMILLSAASCSKKERIELETITVGFGEVCESVTSTGTLESVTQVDIGTQVTGIISKLYADYNSVVKAGDLIAEIDKTTLESELKAADANLESAKLTYEYTKKNYERDLALHDKQLISDYEFDTTRKDYLIAKSSYEKSKSDRVKAARNLSYAEIYAPIDGIVISREVEVGQTVVSNMSVANLFTIADLNNIGGCINTLVCKLRNVNESVDTGDDFSEGAEARDIYNLNGSNIADIVLTCKKRPRICFLCLISERNLSCLGVEALNKNMDIIAYLDNIAGVLDMLP